MNVLVCFFVCFAALCAAQNYQATLNQVTYLQSNFRGMNVFVDTDGVRYYTGQTTSTTVTSVLNNAYNLSPVNGTKGNLDIIVMRVEPNDVITWFTFIGSTAADQPGTSRSYQDFLYVSGSTSGIINGLQTNAADIYLVKLDRFTGKTISTVLITNQTGSDVLNIPKGGSVMEIQDHVLWIAGSRTIASVNSWNIISYDILTGTIKQTLWSPGSTSNPFVILIRDNNVWVGGSCSSNDPIPANQDFSTNSINGCSVGFTKDASNTLTQSYLMTFDNVIYWIDLTESGSIYYTYEDQQRIRLFNATSNYNLMKTIPIAGNAVPMLIPDRFNRIVMMSADASPTYAYYADSGELDNSWFSANAKLNMPTMDSNSLIHADYDDFTQSDTITIYYTGSHVNPSSKSNIAGYGNTYNSKASEAASVRCIDIISIQVTVNDHWTTNALTSQALTTQAITTAAMTTAAMTTAAMTTAEMTTAAMTTNEMTTAAMTTNEMTTAAMTTAEMTTAAMTTNEMTTAAMTTAAMTTNEMTTAAMTTAEMTTAAMTTAEFTTAAMTTAAMTTAAMTTNEMTTAAMTTNEMTTAAMTTAEFTTAAMTTNEMTTAAMTTNEMTTAAMTTAEFTTAAMTTAAMTTNEMTTAAMTTNEMTTAAMTTAAMTTSQMTTAAMTTAEFTTSPLTTAPLTTVYQVTSSAITTNVPALDGGANGDPHMDGFKGQAYEFAGTVGDVYNLYNDPYVNLNAKMGSRTGVTGTFMNAIYLTVGGHQITMDSQYWARKSSNFNVSIDGIARQISQTVTHLTGCVDIQYRPSQKTLPAQVLIQTPDHTITFVPSDFIFYTLQIHDDNIDSSLVGGALGQSAGAGVIDLNEADFRVTTNFGTEKSANYNAGNSFVCP